MAKERAGEPAGWVLTSRFPDEKQALKAYETARDLLLSDDLDASVFRFTVSGVSFVAVLGNPPLKREAAEKVESALRAGQPAELPPGVLDHLRERRRAFKGLRIDYLERRGRTT
jgi:hypothetical protein